MIPDGTRQKYDESKHMRHHEHTPNIYFMFSYFALLLHPAMQLDLHCKTFFDCISLAVYQAYRIRDASNNSD